MGGTSHKKNISMLTPQQQAEMQQGIAGLGGNMNQFLTSILQGQSPEAMQDMFQQTYVDPALQAMEQQIAPAIQQRFADAGAGSSSALNQALAQSAQDLSTAMGSQFGQFMQGQQQLGLQAAGISSPLLTNQTFTPLLQQQSGILGPLIQAGGQVGAAAMMSSSETVKENIRDYKKGLDELSKLEVKLYDYIEQLGGEKDQVGLIAEQVPEELTGQSPEGVKGVNLYGVMGLMVNAIKELNEKIVQLEERCHHL